MLFLIGHNPSAVAAFEKLILNSKSVALRPPLFTYAKQLCELERKTGRIWKAVALVEIWHCHVMVKNLVSTPAGDNIRWLSIAAELKK
ncbi:MAG: hypothetical protein PHQ27_07520 [Victivallales bacterium]|nr:hypothetical protein [Victivallales bacterium]